MSWLLSAQCPLCQAPWDVFNPTTARCVRHHQFTRTSLGELVLAEPLLLAAPARERPAADAAPAPRAAGRTAPDGAPRPSPARRQPAQLDGKLTSNYREGPLEVRLDEVVGAALAADPAAQTDPPSLPLLGQPGYILCGLSHLVAGYPRAGKTELLVRCCAEWTRRGEEILYITEEPRVIWARRLAMVAGAWERLRLVFGLGAPPEALLARAARGAETVIVVDTLRSLLALRDETDNSEVARVLTPWLVALRSARKTVVFLHHTRKGGGVDGEGIAGGHALLGSCDVALELLRDAHAPTRRLVRAYARLVAPPELIYERQPDGTFVALGDPAAVTRAEVQARIAAVLTEEWQPTRAVLEALDEPRPSLEQVRQALTALAREGVVERDPPLDAPAAGARVRWRRAGPRPPGDGPNLTSNEPSYTLEVRFPSSALADRTSNHSATFRDDWDWLRDADDSHDSALDV